jgi:hypothetical protein
MGVPTSEVGYTSATTGRGDHEVYEGHVVALGKKVWQIIRFLNDTDSVESCNEITGCQFTANIQGFKRKLLWCVKICFSVSSQVSHTGVVEYSGLPRYHAMATGKLSPAFCRIAACSSTVLLLHWLARSIKRISWLLVIYRFLQTKFTEIGHEIRLTGHNAPWRLLLSSRNLSDLLWAGAADSILSRSIVYHDMYFVTSFR